LRPSIFFNNRVPTQFPFLEDETTVTFSFSREIGFPKRIRKMEYWAQKPVEVRAIEALGKGFDLSSDFRLKYAKGMSSNNERLVLLDETNKRDVVFPGGLTISNVSEDIRCDKGDRTRYKSDVLEFNQVRFCIFFLFFFSW
jgi:hypothetical protein